MHAREPLGQAAGMTCGAPAASLWLGTRRCGMCSARELLTLQLLPETRACANLSALIINSRHWSFAAYLNIIVCHHIDVAAHAP